MGQTLYFPPFLNIYILSPGECIHPHDFRYLLYVYNTQTKPSPDLSPEQNLCIPEKYILCLHSLHRQLLPLPDPPSAITHFS